jgi:hypothetical protein
VHVSIVTGARDSVLYIELGVLYLFITANAGLFGFMAIKMQ